MGVDRLGRRGGVGHAGSWVVVDQMRQVWPELRRQRICQHGYGLRGCGAHCACGIVLSHSSCGDGKEKTGAYGQFDPWARRLWGWYRRRGGRAGSGSVFVLRVGVVSWWHWWRVVREVDVSLLCEKRVTRRWITAVRWVLDDRALRLPIRLGSSLFKPRAAYLGVFLHPVEWTDRPLASTLCNIA